LAAGCSSGRSRQASTNTLTPTTAIVSTIIATTTLPALLPGSPAADPASCGVERQRVKTGEDPEAGLVDLAHVQPATVAQLDAFAPPQAPGARVRPVEFTVFRVSATLTAYKLERDSDYHLVLAEGGSTMIAEIPSPACVTGGPFRPGIASARAAFDARLHAVPRFQRIDAAVTVTGVGFFDSVHGQLGVAPNGIELHPVLDIVFS